MFVAKKRPKIGKGAGSCKIEVKKAMSQQVKVTPNSKKKTIPRPKRQIKIQTSQKNG